MFAMGPAFANANGPSASDPYFANVVCLMHFDGANGSTTFTDQIAANSWNIQAGLPTISTAQSKFGGSSGNFPVNTNAAIQTADKTALQMGTGDFTIEGWFNPVAGSGAFGAMYIKGSNSAGGLTLTVLPTAVGFRCNTSTTFSQTISAISGWAHIAWVRASGVVTIYVNGISVYSTTVSFNHNDTSTMYLGSNTSAGSGTFSYGGYIDDFRITKGVARYTANFTPPAAPFPNH